MFPSSLLLLFGSLAIWSQTNYDCRPMTLRHQVSLILLFGQPVDPDLYILAY